MSTDLTTLALPDGEVVTEPPVLAEYRLNPYTQETAAEGQPIAVVFATSVADVQATLQFATTHHIPIVTQGARTSIANGAAGLDGSILLNLSRLNHIVALQPENQTAVVEAGVLNGDLDQAARKVGYFYAPDPGSKPISTIGGNIATNAGGMASLKYGTTRENVLGLKVVLADGRLLELGGATFKNNASYDLTDLFIGSEGTLGVVVEATVRLRPIPFGDTVTGLATFADVHALTHAVQVLQASGVNPSMLEVLNRVSIEALDEYEGIDLGGRGEQALLIFQLDVAVAGALDLVDDLLRKAGAQTIDVTSDPDRTATIIKIRQDIFAAGAQYGRLIVEDIAVPLGQLATVADRAEAIAAKHGQRLLLLGHAGDGNLHPDIILESKDGALPAETQAYIDELLPFVISIGGTVSAEHGIGTIKKKWVPQQLSPAVQTLQQQIKAVFDPTGILNPGRKF